MKTKIISLFIILLFNQLVFAQQQKPGKSNIKVMQKMPNTKVKIHANSNSVYRSNATRPKKMKEKIPTESKTKIEAAVKTSKKSKK